MKAKLKTKSRALTLWLGGKPLDVLDIELTDIETVDVIIEARNEDDRSVIQDLEIIYDLPINHKINFEKLKPGETGEITFIIKGEDLWDYTGSELIEIKWIERRRIGGNIDE